MASRDLTAARAAKSDEFYTRLAEIQAEMKWYTDKFVGKVVYCNCDDPFRSNFVKYFLMNFNRLGLRELIASGYQARSGQDRSGSLPSGLCVLRVSGTEAYLQGDFPDLDTVGAGRLLDDYGKTMTPVLGCDTGDFRSDSSLALLKQADIVVTNPPFSLFREYVAQLMAYGKQFLIIGNMNAITYKEFFPLMKDNLVWVGPSITSGDRPFYVPDDYPLAASGCGLDDAGRRYIRVKGVRWFTNLDHEKRHQLLPLDEGITYVGHEDQYPAYDNYEAINVDRVSRIPCDYDGVMGVPITFLDKYCPEQFEILNCNDFRRCDGTGVSGFGRSSRDDMVARPVLDGREVYRRVFIRRRAG